MIVYKPMYVGTRWEVWELDSDLLRHLTGDTCAYFKEGVGFYGTLYWEKSIFRTREAAYRYINKNYVPREDYFEVPPRGY